jgi:hypothetical protein
LIEALDRWLNKHHSRDVPFLQLLGDSICLSPADIVREIKAGSPMGQELVDLFDSASDDVNDVIASLDAEIHEAVQHRTVSG